MSQSKASPLTALCLACRLYMEAPTLYGFRNCLKQIIRPEPECHFTYSSVIYATASECWPNITILIMAYYNPNKTLSFFVKLKFLHFLFPNAVLLLLIERIMRYQEGTCVTPAPFYSVACGVLTVLFPKKLNMFSSVELFVRFLCLFVSSEHFLPHFLIFFIVYLYSVFYALPHIHQI